MKKGTFKGMWPAAISTSSRKCNEVIQMLFKISAEATKHIQHEISAFQPIHSCKVNSVKHMGNTEELIRK